MVLIVKPANQHLMSTLPLSCFYLIYGLIRAKGITDKYLKKKCHMAWSSLLANEVTTESRQ